MSPIELDDGLGCLSEHVQTVDPSSSLDHILWEEERACWEVDYDGVHYEFYDPYGELCVEAGGDPVQLRALMRRIYEPRRGDLEEQEALQCALEASHNAHASHSSTARGGRGQGRGRQAVRSRGQPSRLRRR